MDFQIFLPPPIFSLRDQGKFSGSVLFLDIAGFTSMTSRLAKQGTAGAEAIADLLKNTFSPCIDIVYNNGGWITRFGGDAFTAVFPRIPASSLEKVAQDIMLNFGRDISINGDLKVNISARLGIGSGNVYWEIIKGDPSSVFVFYGSAFENAYKQEAKASSDSYSIDPRHDLNDEFHLDIPEGIDYERRTREFIPNNILRSELLGEFREVVSVFFTFPKNDEYREMIKEMISLVSRCGGYLNKVDFSEKGGIALCIFGAPTSIEHPVVAALEFSSSITRQFPFLSAGITKGTGYSGLTGSEKRMEYTSLGEKVNLAARLSVSASPGEILCDAEIQKSGNQKFLITYKDSLKLKGFSGLVPAYLVEGERSRGGVVRFTGVFTGRTKELERLNKIYAECSAGPVNAHVIISGEAGVGKSRLVNHFIKEHKDEAPHMFLPCSELLPSGFNPIYYFFSHFFNSNSSEGTSLSVFEQKWSRLRDSCEEGLLAELKDKEEVIKLLAGIELSPDSHFMKLQPKTRYENIIQAFLLILKILSNEKVLIVEIEDYQFLDPDTEKALVYALRNTKDNSVIFLFTGRGKVKKDFLAAHSENPEVHISLKSLLIDDTRKVMENAMEGDIDEVLLTEMQEKSSGNPFYIEQLLLYFAENDCLEYSQGKYHLKAGYKGIPGSIKSLIVARYDKLPPEVRSSVRSASVLGMEFSLPILSRLEKQIEIISNIAISVKEHFFLPLYDKQYIFYHAMIKDTIYSMQLKKTLMRLHEAAASIYAELFKRGEWNNPGMIGIHYHNAESSEEAVKYLTLAYEKALSEYKNNEAIDYMEKLLDNSPSPEMSTNVNLTLSKSYILVGRWSEAEVIIDDLVKDPVSESLFMEAILGKTGLFIQQGEYHSAEKLLMENRKIFEKIAGEGSIDRYWHSMGVIKKNLRDYSAAMEYYEKEWTVLEARGENIELAKVMGNIGVIYLQTGKMEKAKEYFLKEMDIAAKCGHKEELINVYLDLGTVFRELGDNTNASIYYKKSQKLSRDLGARRGELFACGNLGILFLNLGEYEEAEVQFNYALKVALELGAQRDIFFSYGNLADLYSVMGLSSKSLEYFYKAVEKAETLEMTNFLPGLYLDMATVHNTAGNYHSSQEYLDKRISLLPDEDDNKRRDLLLMLEADNLQIDNPDVTMEKLIKLYEDQNDLSMRVEIIFRLARCSKDPKYARQGLKLFKEAPVELLGMKSLKDKLDEMSVK